MSPDLMQAFQQARHQVEPTEGGDYLARNPGNQQRHEFNHEGFVTTSVYKEADWQWGLKLTGYGTTDNIQAVDEATRHADGQRIEYRRGNITEWYKNLPIGLEQGFTLNLPPADDTDQLIIEMSIQGDLQARWLNEGQAIAFHDNNGNYALTYHKLVAFDADQQELPAQMVLADNTLQIHVDTSSARWPIVVDPLVVNEQKAAAQTDDAANSDFFGSAVALSSDTALIGMYKDDDGSSDSGSAFVFVRTGTGWALQQKLHASDAFTNDRFGFAVALSANTAIIGANDNDDNGSGSGSAYVFSRSGSIWTEQQKLIASDAAAGDSFGISVAVDGDTVLVGANLNDDSFSGSGSAYVFERNIANIACTETASIDPWCQQQKLNASDADAFDYFGIAVSLSGDSALVGALFNNDTFNDSGSAYVFTRSGGTWTEQQKLNASDPGLSDYFGASVALSGDTALVGAYRNDDSGSDSGSAYVFTRTGSTWTEQQKLTAINGGNGDRFGWSVALDGENALVGASRYTDTLITSGSAYLYTRSGSTWTQQQQFIAPDTAENDEYGYGVAINGDTILVGSPFDDDVELSSGSVYVYNANTYGQWGQQAKLHAVKPDAAAGDNFGYSVAIEGDTALIGAPLKDDVSIVNGIKNGFAYVFVRSGNSWLLQAKLNGDAASSSDDDYFGYSVALSGDRALVGAYRDDQLITPVMLNHGSAYVFSRTGISWSLEQKLTASDITSGDWFGYSVSLDGDTALVGAAFAGDGGGAFYGAAYVFVFAAGSWSEEAILNATDKADGDYFGYSVSIDGESALVGARRNEDGITNPGVESGAAYVFTRSGSTWTQQQKLVASDTAAGDRFGYSVSLYGDNALIGASWDENRTGAAYVFTRTANIWAEQQKLTAFDGVDVDRFGESVSLDGDTALIGAYSDDSLRGSAYLFTRNGNTWTEVEKLTASDRAASDDFGFSVALSGNTALIGAPFNDDDGFDSGSAYFYTFPCGFGREVSNDDWRMIAAPCVPNTPGTVTSTYADDITSTYGSQWVLYERNADLDVYDVLTLGSEIDPGQGLWLRSFTNGTLEVDGTATPVLGHPLCASDNGCFEIILNSTGTGPRANMLGHPLPYDVDWADVRVVVNDTTAYTVAVAQTNSLINKTYHIWNGNNYDAYDDVTPGMGGQLKTNYSIFIKVLDGADGNEVKLLIPAKPSIQTSQISKDLPWYAHVINFLVPSAHAASDNAKGKKAQQDHLKVHAQASKGGGNGGGGNSAPAEWYVRLTVEQPTLGLKDRNSVFGQLSDSINGFDDHDLKELPPFGSTYLTLLFPHQDWGDNANDYASDFHALPAKKGEGDSWTFEVRSDDPGRVLTLSWQGPADQLDKSTLIDTETGIEVPASSGSYEFSMNGQSRSFEWKLGSGGGKGKKK